MSAKPRHLIVNNPYVEPRRHWRFDPEKRSFNLVDGRRDAGYVIATPGSADPQDPGRFVPIELVNKIRPRVNAWREAGWPGVSSITRTLMEHWCDEEARPADRRFFFGQLEAIETLIWLTEASAADRTGVDVPEDGGPFARVCTKLATGGGKTVVMAMIIAWHALNKADNRQDGRFSKSVLIVAPGLTVRERLQVLIPDSRGNYFDEFCIIPDSLRPKLRHAQVKIINWHKLGWETTEQIAKKKSVDKRGPKSDAAYIRDVLGEIGKSSNLIVINDEAHHAWRVPAGANVTASKDEKEQATKWIGGLDRIHRARSILRCFDLSATPFAPSGKKTDEEALFGWIVSDFGLNDAIESGLVKTPRVVIRDDGVPDIQTYRSKLYHIYRATDDDGTKIADDLNRKAESHEPLPDLIRNGYYLLGKDWLETQRAWMKAGHSVPPVMISVANRTETAARIKHAFDTGDILIDELSAPDRTLHIDSKVLKNAEEQDEAATVATNSGRKLTKKEQAELLRRQVDTVGKVGEPGQDIQNVISVAMLSEGWDAKTVTHIMGLRAFSSQLLCEQVVGRGLRRTTYDVDGTLGTFKPEYVNVFGIPFTFMPHEGDEGEPPPPPPPKDLVEAVPERAAEFRITWPNIRRLEYVLTPRLTLDLDRIEPLELDAATIRELATVAPVVAGQPDVRQVTEIDLKDLGDQFRTQRLIFETARNLFEFERPSWRGNDDFLLAQLIGIVERFMRSDKLVIVPSLYQQNELHRRVVLALSMSTIVGHLKEAIESGNTESRSLIFDEVMPIRDTGDMRPWYTGRPNNLTCKSHINRCVHDSTWESCEAYAIERSDLVEAWVKNDHLGFEVLYIYKGKVSKYRPDYLIQMINGSMLALEVKGEDNARNRAKQKALEEWCEVVTEHGGFGVWTSDVSRRPGEVQEILDRVAAMDSSTAVRRPCDRRLTVAPPNPYPANTQTTCNALFAVSLRRACTARLRPTGRAASALPMLTS